jgi:hypothetical protein
MRWVWRLLDWLADRVRDPDAYLDLSYERRVMLLKEAEVRDNHLQ